MGGLVSGDYQNNQHFNLGSLGSSALFGHDYVDFPSRVFAGFEELDKEDAGLLAVDEGGECGVGGHRRLDVIGKISAGLQTRFCLISDWIHNLK